MLSRAALADTLGAAFFTRLQRVQSLGLRDGVEGQADGSYYVAGNASVC